MKGKSLRPCYKNLIKFSRSLYKLAKMAKWSDLLPITVVEYIKTDEGRLYLTPGQKLLAEYDQVCFTFMINR